MEIDKTTNDFNVLFKVDSKGTFTPLAIIIKTKKWYIDKYQYLGKGIINGYDGRHWIIWISNNKRILSYSIKYFKFLIQKLK